MGIIIYSGVVKNENALTASDFLDCFKGHLLAGMNIYYLILAQFIEVAFEIESRPVVHVNNPQGFHIPEGFHMLCMGATEVNHAAIGVYGEQLVIQRRDQICAEFA